MSAPPATVAAALRDRAADCGAQIFLRAGDATWTFGQAYAEACRYANLFLARRIAGAPFHVGVLMDNLPAFVFAELGCALAGATLVGLNPTHRRGLGARRRVRRLPTGPVEARYADQLRGDRRRAHPGADRGRRRPALAGSTPRWRRVRRRPAVEVEPRPC
jgi:fatty-acyl-CoA synthase